MASTPSQERQATEGSEVAEVERSSEENAQRPSAGGEKTQNNDRDIGDHSKDNDENKDNDNESEDDDRSHVGSSSSSNEDDSEEEEEESDSSNSNSSDDDDDNKNNGGNNNENQGLSDYELLRLERIKRNKERLVQLGLESKDGGGVLGKKKKPTSQKRRTSASSTDKLAAPTRRSRRSSAGAVASYAEQNLSTRSIVGEAEKKDPSKSSSKSNSNLAGISGEDNKLRRVGARKEKVREERIPRFIYDEFQIIITNKKDMLKQAEKYARKSEVEYKYWRKRAHVVERRAEREREYQEMLSKLEEEKAIFGTGAYQFVQDLERRVPEIIANVEHYDSMQVVGPKRVELKVFLLMF